MEPGEEDSECDLTANPIFIDPCLDVVPPVVCDETNIDPFLLPPADYCVANPDDNGALTLRVFWNGGAGTCRDAGGYAQCDYLVDNGAMSTENCAFNGRVCEGGACVAPTFSDEGCIDACSCDQSSYCQKCECAGVQRAEIHV